MISATKIIGRLTITVEYACDIVSSINPLVRADGTADESAISEYEEFIVNALSVFDEFDFEVIEEAESDRSHSVYFSLVKHSDAENKDYKYILFVRLSDHSISSERKSSRTAYFADKAEQLKQPTSKRKQTWRFKDVIVNNQLFDSYEDALDDIRKRLQNT